MTGITIRSGHTIWVDEADMPLLCRYSWYVNNCRGRLYAQARVNGKKASMHRLLMDPPRGTVVHHRNGNGLDNRRENLEVTSQRQNIRHRFGKEPEPASKDEPFFPYGKRAQAEIDRLRAELAEAYLALVETQDLGHCDAAALERARAAVSVHITVPSEKEHV